MRADGYMKSRVDLINYAQPAENDRSADINIAFGDRFLLTLA